MKRKKKSLERDSIIELHIQNQNRSIYIQFIHIELE